MRMEISTDELIEEMQQVVEENPTEPDDDPGLTTVEWAEVWGTSTKTAGKKLRKLHMAGLLETGRKNYINMAGARIRVPVYRAKAGE